MPSAGSALIRSHKCQRKSGKLLDQLVERGQNFMPLARHVKLFQARVRRLCTRNQGSQRAIVRTMACFFQRPP